MKTNNQVNPEVRVINSVAVRYLQGSTYKSYDFKTDMELIPGEIVVVESAGSEYALARVDMMHRGLSPKATKWVVDRVDVAAHEARRAREEQMKELKKQMDRRLRAVEEERKYAQLAEQDPEMRDLYEAYTSIKRQVTPASGTPYTAVIPPRRRPESIEGQCSPVKDYDKTTGPVDGEDVMYEAIVRSQSCKIGEEEEDPARETYSDRTNYGNS